VREQRAPGQSRFRPWQEGALLLVLALCCYWPALRGGLVWDDQAHVTRRELQPLAGLARIWYDLRATQQYYPVLHSAFWLEHRIWGDATLGYHLVNVALHVAAACLLVAILRRLRIPGAALAGVIFVVHPVCVESVAWISEQKNTLSLVLYLLSAAVYLRGEEERGPPPAARGSAIRSYFLAFGLFILALLTKSVTATLPAALLVVLWWRNGRLSWRRDVARLLPWFAVAVASGLFTAWVERAYNGAVGADFDLTPVQRLLLSGRVIWFYLGKLVWPARLIFIYPRWNVGSSAPAWAGYLAAALAVTAALWWLRRRWRGPLAVWLFFVGSLFPALGFFDVYPFIYSYVADHFQYLASVGIIAGASSGAALLLARSPPGVRAAGWAAGAGLVAVFVLLSRAQSRNYVDRTTLFVRTIELNPDCFLAHNNVGIDLEHSGHPYEAEVEYRRAIAIKPDLPEAHYNLGHLYYGLPGRLDDAITQFSEAIRLKPDYPEAHDNLGNCFARKSGRTDDAIAQYREALRLRPAYPEAHGNLGTMLDREGRTLEAIDEFRESIRLWPDNAQAHLNLAGAWMKVPGRTGDAISEFEEAVRLRPEAAEIRVRLAIALLRAQGRTDEAVTQLQEALRLRPDLDSARQLLELVRAAQP
jgi:tetratricopeptide (TPR) repeat protein